MIIDAHAHLVPPALLTEIQGRAKEFPAISLIDHGEGFGFSFAGGKPTRPVAKPLQDIAKRTEWMAQNHIDHQVVGGWLDIFGYEIPAAQGIAWSRLINTHLTAQAKSDPRFIALGTVPLQDGSAAADMLNEVMDAGLPGIMIGTQPKGVGGVLDDKSLEPFWQTANQRGAVVFIHPVFESGDNRVHDYGMANAVGRITDTMIAVARLLYAGHPLRYSGAKIVCGIGGAGLPAILGRLRTNHALDSKLGDPEANLRAMWFDTIVQDERTLHFVADIVGTDRLMMGSDAPFPIGDLTPRKLIEKTFEGAARKAIESETARKLFGLQVA
jgi:aminocarboxymuconate-semialdehyde decarboxylase